MDDVLRTWFLAISFFLKKYAKLKFVGELNKKDK
jgi:hypothetical protein